MKKCDRRVVAYKLTNCGFVFAVFVLVGLDTMSMAHGQDIQSAPTASQTITQPSGTSFSIIGSNVGIGTTNPAFGLDVLGSMHARNLYLDTQIDGVNGNLRLMVTPNIFSYGVGSGTALSISSINGSGFSNQAVAQIELNQTTSDPNDLIAKVHLALGGWYQGSGVGMPVYIGNGYLSDNPLLAVVPTGSNGQGNVGIGTTTPGQNLQSLNSSGTLVPYSTTGHVLEVSGIIALSTGQGGSILFPDGTVQSTAYLGNSCPTGGDYAESVDVTGDKAQFEPGDVMVIDPSNPGHFLKSSEPYSTLVSGIYSTKPGFVGRRQTTDPKTTTSEIPMAMVGIVPTKVSAENGAIKVGDLLVTSSALGYIMKGTDRSLMTGAVVGKALGKLDSGTAVIEVLVALQ